MAQFNYIVRTQEGTRQEGSIDADNINDASEKLRSDGLIVVKITERDTSFDFLTPFRSRLFFEVNIFHSYNPRFFVLTAGEGLPRAGNSRIELIK